MWSKPDPVDQILTCLDKESSLLITGNFAELSDLPDRKTELLEKMSLIPVDVDVLSDIRAKASRNGRLLEQAVKAIREVSERLRSMNEKKPVFESYNAHGGRHKIGGHSGQLSRKL